MSYKNPDSAEFQKEMSEWSVKLDELLLNAPLEKDVLKYMGQNTREKLIALAKLAQELEAGK